MREKRDKEIEERRSKAQVLFFFHASEVFVIFFELLLYPRRQRPHRRQRPRRRQRPHAKC